MKNRTKSFIWLMASLTIVIVLAARTYFAQREYLNQFESACKKGRAIVLNGETVPEAFATFLVSHNYVIDNSEAIFVSRTIIDSIRNNKGSLHCLKELEQKKYGLKLDSNGYKIISQYPDLLFRADKIQSSSLILESHDKTPEEGATKRYTVRIRDEKKMRSLIKDTTYICIKEHWNELITDNGSVIDCFSHDSIYACFPIYGKTDFWLPVKTTEGGMRYFSILPVANGYSFGPAQKTYKHKRNSFTFLRDRAVLPLLSKDVLKKMRADNSIGIRSAIDYRDKFISSFVIFATSWLLIFLILILIDKKRREDSELKILSLVSLLCGLGLVALFNVQNPIWGQLFAWHQITKGLLPGSFLLLLFSYIDWIELYNVYNKEMLAHNKNWPQGLGFAASALCIALILLMFGHGPGGTHIELPLIHIQGSPIIKLLILCYMAIAFVNNRNLLESYASNGKIFKQLFIVLTVVSLLFLLGIMQIIMSDLGPFIIVISVGLFLFAIATHEVSAMLVGSTIFVVSLSIGMHLFNGSKLVPFMAFILWATLWMIYGYYKHNRVQISAIIFSLIILLTFHGGSILESIGLHDIATRLSGRTEMAVNIFDNEVMGGSQLAEGIWAITRGGIWGNPGTSLSASIPAGYTDLIGNTIIENTGLLGFALLLIIGGLLIILELRVGIRSGHPLAFALCSVFALSFAIQSSLILFGELGIVPLTGITLPFESYSGTALSFELASIGIVISLSRKQDHKLELINTRKYESMSCSQIRAYVAMAVVAFLTVFHYSCVSRDKYMVKPGIFVNKDGERMVMYNPNIDATLKKMVTGDIFDIKGKLLAGTDNGRRVYPYGNKTFFMVGDSNTKTLWGSAGFRPAGLLAEERYYSKIRGFDTNPHKLRVISKKHLSKYLPDVVMNKKEYVVIEDYTSLIPLMKSDAEIQKWNTNKYTRNIYLTFDADLQSSLELESDNFVRDMKSIGKTTSGTRITIVAIDAFDGSLLTSSVWPLPNQSILRERTRANETIYRDWGSDFAAFTDMDLGLVEPLAPGSAIKLLSAGAGLNRFSTKLATTDFNQFVYDKEIIDITLGEPTGNVTLFQSIVKSSNVYYIKLVNKYGESGLYPELADLYYAVGARFGNATPYVLYPDEVLTDKNSYYKQVVDFGRNAANKYAAYESSGVKHRLIDAEYQPAWGQGNISMTPVSLCRYVAAIANGGRMMRPRYVSTDTIAEYKQLLSLDEALILQDCMKGQAAGRFGELSSHIGGKTGTPTRADKASSQGKSNDAIYAFFIDETATVSGHPLAIVVRMERVNDYSRLVIQMTRDVIIPVLREQGYIR